MDGWFVALAAGAGYLAKHWQLVAKVKEASLDGDDGKPSSKNSEFTLLSGKKRASQNTMTPRRLGSSQWNSVFQRLAHRELGDEPSSNTGDKACVDVADSTKEIASTSGVGGGILTNMGGSGERNVSSSMSLLPQSPREENNQESGNTIDGNSEFSHVYFHEAEAYHRKLSTGFGCGRFRRSRKAKWNYGYASIRPLNSLESCAIAQMYKEHVEMEEYIFNSLETPPSTPAARPFIITDGNRIISKARNDASTLRLEHQAHWSHIEDVVKLREKEVVMGIPPRSKTGLLELPRNLEKQKGKTSNGHSNGYDMGLTLEKFPSRGACPSGLLLGYIVVSAESSEANLSNRRAVDNLKDLLKQSQNLVQDLQEELEMKDSLTVKELANEACGFQEINDQSTCTKGSTSPFQAQGAFTSYLLAEQSIHWTDNDEHCREEDNLESMSKIEAELEAELERLEMNINSSSLEKRLSDLGEFDPDLVADVVHGELRVDVVNGGTDFNNHGSTSGSSTTHTHPANYAVSPKELSLRLHEVIQSRLEERILELEAALQDSQKRLHFVEIEWMNSQKGLLNSDIGSPSTQESPMAVQHGNATVRPLFLNLSGDALDAYDEAYAEFMKITNSEEKRPLSTVNGIGELTGGAGDQNMSLPHYKISQGDLFHASESEYEDSDDHDDEMGKLLIKQIVERTRQGSPVVLNAQRILFSMDEQLTK
ncbi:hypothetical protein ACLOJK_002480 [Asimina triloba]